MPLQWRVCSRWALLGSIQRDVHEAFLVLDPLIRQSEAMSLLAHLCSVVLQDTNLWQHAEVQKPGLFG